MQLGTVLKELGEVKDQLGVMQENKIKLFAVNTIQKAEHQVKTLRSQVEELKTKFVERAEQAVFSFKEKGKDALASAVKGLHLTQGLQKLQSSLHTVMLSMDQKIDRLGSMAEELHVAKGHLKNAFCKRSPQMVPSLELSLHHADDPLYNEGEYPLATGEKGKELLSYVPYYANHPLVQEEVRELEKLEEQQKRQKK